MQEFVIDAFSFCRLAGQQSGSSKIADFSRLAAECASTAGALDWTLTGGTDGLGHAQMKLSVRGTVQLMCQRCLTPFAFDISSESTLILATSEEHADEIEASLESESVDVVVGSTAFKIMDLIEDEALLAIPQSPRHAVCPDVTASAAPAQDTPESPFAVLKKINGRT